MVAVAEVLDGTDPFGSGETDGLVCGDEQGRAGFTGYITDSETGLCFARTRMYSPTLGRFVGRDALTYAEGYSLYLAYFVPRGVDPLGMYDPDDPRFKIPPPPPPPPFDPRFTQNFCWASCLGYDFTMQGLNKHDGDSAADLSAEVLSRINKDGKTSCRPVSGKEDCSCDERYVYLFVHRQNDKWVNMHCAVYYQQWGWYVPGNNNMGLVPWWQQPGVKPDDMEFWRLITFDPAGFAMWWIKRHEYKETISVIVEIKLCCKP